MSLSKRKLTPDQVAEMLYADMFVPISGGLVDSLSTRILSPSHLEVPSNDFIAECQALVSFLITFSFQRKFVSLGNEKCKYILDIYHSILADSTNSQFKGINLAEIIGRRYPTYYPLMKEDMSSIGNRSSEVLFYGMTDAFFHQIAPHLKESSESLLFGFYLSEVYSLLDDAYNKIGKYSIA